MNIWIFILFIILSIILSILTIKVINGGAIELPNGYVDASNEIVRVTYSGKNIIVNKKHDNFKYIFKNLPLGNYEMKAEPWNTYNGKLKHKTKMIKTKKSGYPSRVEDENDIGYIIQTKVDGGFVVWIKNSNGIIDDFIFAYDEAKKLVLTNGIAIISCEAQTNYCSSLDLYTNSRGEYIIDVKQVIYYPGDNIVYLKTKSDKVYSITKKKGTWLEVLFISDYYKNTHFREDIPKDHYNLRDKIHIYRLFKTLPDRTDSNGKTYKIANMVNLPEILEWWDILPMISLSLTGKSQFEFKKIDLTEYPENDLQIIK